MVISRDHLGGIDLVPRGRIEPPTRGFSVGCSKHFSQLIQRLICVVCRLICNWIDGGRFQKSAKIEGEAFRFHQCAALLCVDNVTKKGDSKSRRSDLC